MAKLYISNEDKSARMFKSGLMEFFTHVHPVTPLILYVPVVSFMVYLSYSYEMNPIAATGLFLFGVFVWTITEYIMHRFIFHFKPRNRFMETIHFVFHGVHHDYPRDSRRLVMPPAVSIPLAFSYYYGFKFVLGEYFIPPFFAGFVVGYLFYDMIHYATHHLRMERGVWSYLKKHHTRHHYMDLDKNYGVSSPFWDFVFGTYTTKKQGANDTEREMVPELSEEAS